jgi:CTP synthase (UTP-ammonia lyase)
LKKLKYKNIFEIFFLIFFSDFQLICRSATEMPASTRSKLSMFSHVNEEQVICLPDVNNVYKVPLILNDNNLFTWFTEHLQLSDILKVRAIEIANSRSMVAQQLNQRRLSSDRETLYFNMEKWHDMADR